MTSEGKSPLLAFRVTAVALIVVVAMVSGSTWAGYLLVQNFRGAASKPLFTIGVHGNQLAVEVGPGEYLPAPSQRSGRTVELVGANVQLDLFGDDGVVIREVARSESVLSVSPLGHPGEQSAVAGASLNLREYGIAKAEVSNPPVVSQLRRWSISIGKERYYPGGIWRLWGGLAAVFLVCGCAAVCGAAWLLWIRSRYQGSSDGKCIQCGYMVGTLCVCPECGTASSSCLTDAK